MQNLHDTIRAACASRTWSRGVQLVRDDAVAGQEASDDEIVCRVVQPGRAVPPTVVLYPEDEEWDCDCPSKIDPCEHVAAAVIAVAQARKRGRELPISSRGGGRIRYHFEREAGGLYLERGIVTPEGREVPLKTSLSSRGSPSPVGPAITPTQTDLQIDLFVGAPRRRALTPDVLASLFELLAGDHDVRLDGAPVTTSSDPVVPRAIVRDARGGGVALRLERDPRVDEVVARGVARCGSALHPIGEVELSGLSLDRLPFEKVYGSEEVGELVTDVLPELKKRLEVDVRSRRGLPGAEAGARPRIAFEIEQEAGALSVLPTLVYGDPPQARIDAGRMVHLGGAVPIRDEAAERRLVHGLRDALNLVPGRRARFEGRDALAFTGRLARFQGGDEAPVKIEAAALRPEIETEGGFEVSFRAEGAGGGRAAAGDVLRAYESGYDVVPLTGGGFGRLPAAWLDENAHRVAQILAAKQHADEELPAVAAPAAAALCDDLEHPRPQVLSRLAPLVEGFDGLAGPELPDDLAADLRGYQREGVAWLSFLRDAQLGGVLADDMGLGKTLQALCAVRGRALVVCPTSVAHNWLAEIAKFRPSARAALYHGARRELDRAADITVTTYGILRQDIGELASEAWDAVVLDEAQAIKNPDSQVARAAYRLRAPLRLTLTGTPIENRLDELWSQMHFANPGLLGGRAEFQDRIGRAAAAGDPRAVARLRDVVGPFVLRRLKREVAPELPPRTEMVLRCELTAEERAVYDAVRAAAERDVVQALEQGGSVLQVLELLLRMRQAACHSGLVPGHEAESSSKVDTLVEHLEEIAAEGHKALVFSQFTSLLDRVQPHLERVEMPFVRLDGATRDRAAVVDAFQDPDGPPAMLISLKAGGTGLNLTAADHVYLLDPWWNPAAEDQAADRAHRIGQDKPVMVYRLVAQDTVEERILALQERKRALVDAALGEAGRAAELTREDLLALLADGGEGVSA